MDPQNIYSFSCTPAETRGLVAAMRLAESSDVQSDFPPLPGAPDYRSWKGRREYSRVDEGHTRFYNLVTDASETQVYVRFGDY